MKKIEEKEIMKVLWDYHQELTSTDEDVRDRCMQKAIDRFLAIIAQDRKELKDAVEKLLEPNRENPKSIRVAKATGKAETRNGPIAMARTDGYAVGVRDALALLTPNEE